LSQRLIQCPPSLRRENDIRQCTVRRDGFHYASGSETRKE
jgi:hypothetical protein